MQKITKSTVLPTEIIDKINELVDYKQDLLTPDNTTIEFNVVPTSTTLTAVCDNPSATVTNNYSGVKETVGTVVETYTAQTKYGWKINSDYITTEGTPIFNTTTGKSTINGYHSYYRINGTDSESDSFLGNKQVILSITIQNSTATGYILQIGSLKIQRADIIEAILDDNPSSSITITYPLNVWIQLQTTFLSGDKWRVKSLCSCDKANWIEIITKTVDTDELILTIGSREDGSDYATNITFNMFESYVDDNYFAIPDTNNILGLEWLLQGSVSELPQGVSVSNFAAGDKLTCTFVTAQQTEVSTKNRADTDLSNLTSTGKYQLFGKFIATTFTLVSSGTSVKQSGGTSLPIDVSSYLPNDGKNYLVYIEGRALTTTTSGGYTPLYVNSDLCGQMSICRVRTRTSSNMTACGSVILPVGAERKIYMHRGTDWSGTCDGMYARGYSRIGDTL